MEGWMHAAQPYEGLKAALRVARVGLLLVEPHHTPPDHELDVSGYWTPLLALALEPPTAEELGVPAAQMKDIDEKSMQGRMNIRTVLATCAAAGAADPEDAVLYAAVQVFRDAAAMKMSAASVQRSGRTFQMAALLLLKRAPSSVDLRMLEAIGFVAFPDSAFTAPPAALETQSANDAARSTEDD
jgi:hypothetical protein